MIKSTAGSIRAGISPVVAVFAVLGSFVVSGHKATAAETTDPAIAGPAESSAPAAKPSADAGKPGQAADAGTSTDKAPDTVRGKDAGKDKVVGPVANPVITKIPEPQPQKSADTASKPAEAAAKSAGTAQAAKPADAKLADKDKSVAPVAAATSVKADEAQKPSDAGKVTSTAASAATTTATSTALATPDKPDTAGKDAAGNSQGAPKSEPPATAALPQAAAPAPATGVADAVLPPADPIVAEVRKKLASGGKGEETAALVAFYDAHNGPAVWVSASGLTPKAKAVIKEFGKADDWGLQSADFRAPQVGDSLTPESAADAEIKLAQLVLKYARYARGGRINPASISQLMDVSPTLIEPKRILADITILDAPDAYLRSLHPKHVQFELLRQALLKARGTSEKVEDETPAEDPALAVKLPPGGVLRPGAQDPQIALLRQRLKVAAEDPAKENIYDDKLADAVKEFQRSNSLRDDAIVGNGTRAVLNGQPKPAPVTADAKIERILINMERWRWLPEDLGKFYVWDNVPEALTRVVKDGKIIHTDRIIVGQPSWPTPFFSADMKTVVFHPTWGVPDGIKSKELGPILRKSSGGGLFGMFGGGYSAEAVLEAYQLRAYVNGRQVDANSIDWSSIDIRSVSFQQPPGPKNPLGDIKFLFPNKHDVYMHDTPERDLFSRPFRALSHGCMRVNDPRRFAEIILGEDKGWSPEKVRGMFSQGSADVPLTQHIPVHVTYLTARVDENGKLQTYADFYGLDGRTAAALTGKAVRFEQPAVPDDVTASNDDPEASPLSSDGSQRKPGGRKKQYGGPPTLADAISGLFSP